MQLFRVFRIWPSLGRDPRDRLGIEPTKLRRALRIVPAPRHDGLGPSLLQWRIVEKSVRPRRQHFERKRRGLGKITGDDADGAGEFEYPSGICVDANNDRVYVTDRMLHRVTVFDRQGAFQYAFASNFDKPISIAVAKGRVYVSDLGSRRVQAFELPKW